MTKLGDAFGHLVMSYIENELLRGTVISVDKNNKTCDVEPIDGGAIYRGVKLTAAEGENNDSFVLFPLKGSVVYIGKIDGNSTDTFVAKVTAVESVQFYDGKNGGMCITPELIKQLNKLSKRVDRLENAINNAKAAAGSSDGGTSLLTTMITALKLPLENEDFSKIEDKRITH